MSEAPDFPVAPLLQQLESNAVWLELLRQIERVKVAEFKAMTTRADMDVRKLDYARGKINGLEIVESFVERLKATGTVDRGTG